MTTSTTLAMPIDIPWKRLALCNDMMDQTYGDRDFPRKWWSSIVVFYYEPPQQEQRFDDRTIAFLKVSCTVTGVQHWWGQDTGYSLDIRPEWFRHPTSGQISPWVLKEFETKGQYDYYPCYGALLQVSVFPPETGNAVSLDNYPIFLDFEPKKREFYLSETLGKNIMSTSRSGLEVKKGETTTISQETRWDFGGSLSLGGESGSLGMSGGMGQTFGTSMQHVNMLTTDSSREKREEYSYSTNLSHMYHLLNSYHLGTNRAMFFLQPRPDIQEEEFTFVKGFRRLEGIQEFFFIVDRPKEIPGLCVEAKLETAHIKTGRTFSAKIIDAADLDIGENRTKTAEVLKLDEDEIDPVESLVKTYNDVPTGKRVEIWRYINADTTYEDFLAKDRITEEE